MSVTFTVTAALSIGWSAIGTAGVVAPWETVLAAWPYPYHTFGRS